MPNNFEHFVMRFGENPGIFVLAGKRPSWVWDPSSGFNVSSVWKAFAVLSSCVPRYVLTSGQSETWQWAIL